MQKTARFQGTLDYIYANWPTYASHYGLLIAAFIFMGISAEQSWFGYIPITLAYILLTGYYLTAKTWNAYQLFDEAGLNPQLNLFKMINGTAKDKVVYIDVGLRKRPLSILQKLSTGHLTVLDIYSPQATPNSALNRWRSRHPYPRTDPRLTLLTSNTVALLPLPDNSVKLVIICQTLAELWQHGDQLTLLQEISRALTRDGRLIIAEKTRDQTAWLTRGPFALSTPSANYWRTLINDAGFRVTSEKSIGGLLHTYLIDRGINQQAKQLAFDLEPG